MRRRDFVAAMGGAIAWPIAARAQRRALPVVGFLNGRSADDFSAALSLFHQALSEVGYVEDQNIKIEYRWADGHSERLPAMAADLVQRRIDIIFAAGGILPSLAAKAATTTIPIVFLHGGDPVRLGLVSSINRPGGNITGLSNFADELDAKRLQLFLRLIPGARAVAVLANPDNSGDIEMRKEILEAAIKLGKPLHFLDARTENEIDRAFAQMVALDADGLFVESDPFFGVQAGQIVDLAARNRIPASYWISSYVEAGGLMSYGADARDDLRQLAYYISRILKGAKAAELPVQRSRKFEFVINLKSAKALGLEVPPNLLALTDRVIE
jgi:putative tryptophan/tyrosine transport system substrate-binding protein